MKKQLFSLFLVSVLLSFFTNAFSQADSLSQQSGNLSPKITLSAIKLEVQQDKNGDKHQVVFQNGNLNGESSITINGDAQTLEFEKMTTL